ncbi:MAG: ROK family protein [Bryobacteraceae bacterium]|nr:ROK family protein [Bryobacteraceae bacterium]
MYGGIEAGGTKFVCAVGTGPGDLLLSGPIPTTTPRETMKQVMAFFAPHRPRAVGIGSFGPVNLAAGRIARTTPKVAWRGYALRRAVEQALGVPVVLDTDVNAAAWGEHIFGGAPDPFLYVTAGTGIGGGGVVNGQLLHGKLHPEMGHLLLRRAAGDTFPGLCPAHQDCLEGMASGLAVAARRKTGEQHFVAEYLALGLLSLSYAYSPLRIILGGGVMKTPGLRAQVRNRMRELNAGYAPLPAITGPRLGDCSGVLGALALAHLLAGNG